jgi:hypothetical protein
MCPIYKVAIILTTDRGVAVQKPCQHEARPRGALLSLLASKDQVGWVWDTWLNERLKRHSKTDSLIEMTRIREEVGIQIAARGMAPFRGSIALDDRLAMAPEPI